MYQDLSFMNVPLPEDVLKLKIYGFLKKLVEIRYLTNVPAKADC